MGLQAEAETVRVGREQDAELDNPVGAQDAEGTPRRAGARDQRHATQEAASIILRFGLLHRQLQYESMELYFRGERRRRVVGTTPGSKSEGLVEAGTWRGKKARSRTAMGAESVGLGAGWGASKM